MVLIERFMMLSKTIAFLFLMSFSVTVLAFGVFTTVERTGFYGYCHYTDGGITTVSPTGTCPDTNEAQGSKTSTEPVINKEKTSVGILKSQSVRGFTRYCTYNNGAIKTIKSIQICPTMSTPAPQASKH